MRRSSVVAAIVSAVIAAAVMAGSTGWIREQPLPALPGEYLGNGLDLDVAERDGAHNAPFVTLYRLLYLARLGVHDL